MKKNAFLLALCGALLFASCATSPKVPKVLDRGIYNPNNVPETDLVTLTIEGGVGVLSIDNDSVLWYATGKNTQVQTVKVPAGAHAFTLFYMDGSIISTGKNVVIANLVAGQTYVMDAVIKGDRIQYIVTDSADGSSALLDREKLAGNGDGVIPAYIKYVLNPTMKEVGHTVKLENENSVILYKPDMSYTQTERKTGKTAEGYRGFVTDFTMKAGTVYLLETDTSKMTSDEFLNKSDYQKTAQTVLTPVACDAKSVTYRYEKPESLKGTEVTYSITELK